MWGNFSFPCMTIVGKLKISPHMEKLQKSPHDSVEKSENLHIWHVCGVEYVVIYAKDMKFSCGEKMSEKVHLWGENDKYEVWAYMLLFKQC